MNKTEAAVTAAKHAGETPALRTRGYLPHIELPAATYSITFRLMDSLPLSVWQRFLSERESALKATSPAFGSKGLREKAILQTLFSEHFDSHLDEGSGECILKDPVAAEIVALSLMHFNSIRYRLFAWCVMPNHVHLVIKPFESFKLSTIIQSIKSFTAHEINRKFGRTGSLWHREYYDHIVRTDAELTRIVEYVRFNPIKPGLIDWKWVS